MSITTVAAFQAAFPEFENASAAQIQFYLNLAETRLDPCRWADLWTYGVELYTAHSVALAQQRAATAGGGGAPGATTGVVASKSVGGVSKSMDIAIVTIEGAGTFNLTSYGAEYYQLMLSIGIGGVQLGAGFAPADTEIGLAQATFGYSLPII